MKASHLKKLGVPLQGTPFRWLYALNQFHFALTNAGGIALAAMFSLENYSKRQYIKHKGHLIWCGLSASGYGLSQETSDKLPRRVEYR